MYLWRRLVSETASAWQNGLKTATFVKQVKVKHLEIQHKSLILSIDYIAEFIEYSKVRMCKDGFFGYYLLQSL